jgi:hypothetical protein
VSVLADALFEADYAARLREQQCSPGAHPICATLFCLCIDVQLNTRIFNQTRLRTTGARIAPFSIRDSGRHIISQSHSIAPSVRPTEN